MCNEHFSDARERILMKNIAYAGALVALLNIDLPIVEQLLDENGSRARRRLRESNTRALMLGYEYARSKLRLPASVPSRADECE